MTPDSPLDPLRDLLARVREGDEEALAALLRGYEHRLRTAARVLLGPLLRPHLDSLDLVQSLHRTLLPGFRQGKFTFDDPEQLLALARTVIRRKVADACRRLRRTPGGQNADSTAELADQLTSCRPDDDPERVATVRDAVTRVLAELPDVDRAAVVLRLEGHDAAEIAANLGTDAHAIRARLSRVRARLRAAGCSDWV
jgi:RNA polymerase sigma factor (sigma-70 family)